jgi:hypothetical protein
MFYKAFNSLNICSMPFFQQVHFVGLDKSDNGRSCDEHKVCGANSNLKVGQYVSFEKAASFGCFEMIQGSLKLSRKVYPDTIFVKYVR